MLKGRAKVKQKGYKFKEKVDQLHTKKQSFWGKATGGRMK